MAEPFQSLYRRYRPQRFSELRGQDHVVLALRNDVRDDRVAHAYLFSGPRGTGKTSTARILAKALNCAKPEEGEPCGQCDSCIDIARGASLDVHELDAASNNGVEAMRDLVARASLATPGKWKVYIVDEVHMLTTGAANALLKTLEEPPSHVVFVLATTDPQKVLPTIKSRTQHFEFHLLDAELLSTLLTDVARDADLELPADGIESAVRRGHGSARDALSALDQVAAAGVIDDDDRYVRDLISAISERDTALALRTVSEAMVAGFDASRLAGELVDGLRVVFLSVVAPSAGVATAGDPVLGPARSVRALEVVGTAIVDMREALDARTTFEVALVKLTHPEVDDTPAALLERLERLERRVADLASGGGPAGRPGPGSPAIPPSSPPGAAPTQAPAPALGGIAGGAPALGAFRRDAATSAAPAGPPPSTPPVAEIALPAEAAPPPAAPTGPAPTRDDLVAAWGDHVLTSLRAKPRAVFTAGRFVACDDGVAVFALPNSANVGYAEPLLEEVSGALSKHFDSPVRMRLVTEAELAGEPPAPVPAPRVPGAAQSPKRPIVAPPVNLPVDDLEPEQDEMDPSDSGGAHDPVSWAASRLLEAFPGAEEVP